MFKKYKKNNKGYTLVEVIFYVVLFALLSVVLLDVMINMTGLFMKTMTNRDIRQGSNILENISRELKQANDFSFNSNVLIVNTEDSSNNPKTITYTFSNSNVGIVDSALGNLGNLNTPNVSVMSFNVVTINTLKSKAAKINLSIKSNRYPDSNTEDFQTTVVLRGSYSK
jgi:type II secretory pathway pseudopilin PulG